MTDHPEQPLDMVREDFEAWFKKNQLDTNPFYWTREYACWHAWQAATQLSAARIAELEAEVQSLRRDAERLDWMEKNLFSREPDDWDSKYGICKDGKNWMWAVFAPSGVQGGARRIIDAAIEAERGGA